MTRNKKTETTDLGEMTMLASSPVQMNSLEACEILGFYQMKNKLIPKYATDLSAGFDLRADLEIGDKVQKYDHQNQKHEISVRGEDIGRLYLEPGDRVLVPTGLCADISEGFYIAIHSRSGTSWKQGLILTNGVAVIDSDYVEEIKVSLTNISGSRVYIEDGERIAQALLMPAIKADIVNLDKKPKQKTSRAGGFGSTGEK